MENATKSIDFSIYNLKQNGYSIVENAHQIQLDKILAFLGKVIQTTDIVVKPDSKALVTSARALDFHTDHHKADYIAWYCLEQTDQGGETILLNAEQIYRSLAEEHQLALQCIKLFEHKIFEDDQDNYPLVEIVDSKPRFYYSYWFAKNIPLNSLEKEALKSFQEKIRVSRPIKIKLKKNDILIVDNRRIFHGRTEIVGTKNRFLKRFWIQESL